MLLLDTPIQIPGFAVVGINADLTNKRLILSVAVILNDGHSVLEAHSLTIMNGDGNPTTNSTGLRAGTNHIVEEFSINQPGLYDGCAQAILTATLTANGDPANAVAVWASSVGILPAGTIG